MPNVRIPTPLRKLTNEQEVVPATGGTPTLADLRAHCAAQLASHKHPRRLAVVDAIPRTAPTGQVQRRLLVERLS